MRGALYARKNYLNHAVEKRYCANCRCRSVSYWRYSAPPGRAARIPRSVTGFNISIVRRMAAVAAASPIVTRSTMTNGARRAGAIEQIVAVSGYRCRRWMFCRTRPISPAVPWPATTRRVASSTASCAVRKRDARVAKARFVKGCRACHGRHGRAISARPVFLWRAHPWQPRWRQWFRIARRSLH